MMKRKFLKSPLDEGIQFVGRRFRFVSHRKEPAKSIEKRFKKRTEVALIIALSMMIGVFQSWKTLEKKVYDVTRPAIKIQVEDVPVTQQRQRPPAPSRPAIPMEAESEDIPEDLTISTTEIDLSELPPPPPPPREQQDESTKIFVAYDEPPVPVGGFAELQRNLIYPEIARKSGIEGRVVLQVIIGSKGEVGEIKVIKSLGLQAMDEAAINAIRSVEWLPARQRDKPVSVLIAVPIIFSLS